ncbi:N-acetylmuramic acid 6-phosphate etherase [Priestia flexa]|uniref:N-acetylmuramic acid 6-phosphate etherase n=1 Tax=Priestia flexa TaxID=86664 RepID=UPI00209D1558|nr:N-acetylmuramic acid 6-phosphate etherase [Priestia flexa]MCP1190002.1 N-acetylmuramic acid 6-phosphate etherase [Priestia flexa]
MDRNLTILTTESRNERTMNIDAENTADILRIMNEEDQKVAVAVNAVLPDIEATVEYVVQSLKAGGRLIYIGAGTSGRLGVLDAVECPPTFSTHPSAVQGIMAGGASAFTKAAEGAEDSEEGGVQDLQRIELTSADTVIGIAASGRTPYVIGALRYAKSIGAKAIALSCNENAAISQVADRAIEVIVGPEILTGSTRLKSATAHKMILNMISTASMIKLGKAYGNLMVDVNVSNYKLKERAVGIIEKVTAAPYEEAKKALEEANNEVKTAIVMIKTQTTVAEARTLLEKNDGYVRKAIEHSK